MNNQTALLPQQENLSVARPELNLEKWPGIFTPAQSRSKPRVRILERKKTSENGSVTIRKVTIDPSLQYGNLTTEDQKVWYGILELWERAGRPRELLFSLSQLAKVLSRAWNGETAESLKKSLKRLNRNSISWENSYYDNVSKKTLEVLNEFHILSDLKIVVISEGHKINNEQCLCKFGDILYQNLLNSYTKPTFLEIVLSFKSGVAQLLYKYLELIMHNKTSYERNSKELFFIDLGLDSEEYKYASNRKRILLVAVKEVNGKPIQNGILEVKLVETKDKSDWKIVVVKSPQLSLFETEEREQPATTPLPNEAKPTPKTLTVLATELITYFLEKFHLPRKNVLKNELMIAKEWIKTYKLDSEKGQLLVNWSKQWAMDTNFAIQNFAGLGQYLDRALEKIGQIEAAREKARAIDACKFCNEDGLIRCEEIKDGRRYSETCCHNLEKMQKYCNKYQVKMKLENNSILEPK